MQHQQVIENFVTNGQGGRGTYLKADEDVPRPPCTAQPRSPSTEQRQVPEDRPRDGEARGIPRGRLDIMLWEPRRDQKT